MTSSKMLDTLVFDFDGVIADTERLYWRSWAEIFEPSGIPFTWEQYCVVGRGIPDEQMITSLGQIEDYGIGLAGIEELNLLRKQKVRDWCMERPPISEATIALLHSLRDIRLGLVTSSTRRDVEPLLRLAGIHQCFDSLVYGDDVKAHKPAPDPYLLARQQLNTSVGLAFEDSDAGIRSAEQAGFTVIRVEDPEDLPAVCTSGLRDFGYDVERLGEDLQDGSTRSVFM